MIVSQVFLNLFIAIILDAFFGQSDVSDLPMNEPVLDDYRRVWSDYDKQATGFMEVDDLDKLIIDLANCAHDEGGKLLGKLKDKIKIGAKKEKDGFKSHPYGKVFRNRFIKGLEIPTFKNMKKVMFYDVLMKFCMQELRAHVLKDMIEAAVQKR